jgi:DNA-binding MarR family transcriptional regulator
MTLSELADGRKCVRSNITQLVDRLEADGLVRRIDDPADRRAIRAQVTPLGIERFEAGWKAVGDIQTDLASRISTDEQANFLKVLSALSHG